MSVINPHESIASTLSVPTRDQGAGYARDSFRAEGQKTLKP